LAVVAFLASLAFTGQAWASETLYLNGSCNSTAVKFLDGSHFGSNNPSDIISLTGGGVVGGTLDAVAMPYLYC
jgi:hypothetical protein